MILWAFAWIAFATPVAAAADECAPVAARAVPLSGQAAVRVARATSQVREHRATRVVLLRLCHDSEYVGLDGKRRVFDVVVDGKTGRVKHAWGGYHAEYPLARGSGNLFVAAGAPIAIAVLTLVFLGAFFDPRRPFRATHLDLLALVAATLSLIPYGYGKIGLATPLVFAALGLLVFRMVAIARRPRSRVDPLAPLFGPRVLLGAAVLLLAGRVAYNVLAGPVSDVGYYSVYGAQSLLDGYSIYDQGTINVAAYGPAMHLAYVPFAELFPLPSGYLRGSNGAAHAAAVAFDLLTAGLLYLFGRRLRHDARGHALGAALAFAWAANPLVFYAMVSSTNDALIPLLIVIGMLGLASPAARGVAAGLAAAAKWVPAVLVPVLAAGTQRLTARTLWIFGLAFIGSVALSAMPFVPDGGPLEIYRVSVGDLATVQTPFNIWGLWDLPGALRELFFAAVAIGALAAAWVPRERTPASVAALATAILAATEMALPHWTYAYAVWFMATGAIAICATHEL